MTLLLLPLITVDAAFTRSAESKVVRMALIKPAVLFFVLELLHS